MTWEAFNEQYFYPAPTFRQAVERFDAWRRFLLTDKGKAALAKAEG